MSASTDESGRLHPVAGVVLSLVVGLGAAAALAVWGPAPAVWTLELPVWLADQLSSSGDRQAVFTQIRAMWLMPVAVLPLLLFSLSRTLVDAPKLQLALQLFARLAVLLGVATAIAQPSLRSPIQGKTVVFVVDVSDSIDDAQLAQARALVRKGIEQLQDEAARDLPREDRTRLELITYATDTEVLEIDTDQIDIATHLRALIVRHAKGGLGSRHDAALRLAAALIDPQTEGRLVLITDGGGSLAEREGLGRATRELETQGLGVHLRRFAPKAIGDVYVTGVHLPGEMRLGETFQVAVDLVASSPGTLTLHLDRNGEANPLEPSVSVQVRGGPQQVLIKSRVTQPGAVVYTARIEESTVKGVENRRLGNDRASVAGEVRGRPKILLAGSDGNAPLASALRVDHLDVTVVGGAGIPTTLEGMRAYDLVMFSDLPARAVGREARAALNRYVRDHGGGFIMVGGDKSFGMGGWSGSTVEKLLPVRSEGERQREQPKLALVLVIDKSGSMSSEDKLDLVKEASRATARTLDATDEIGVIAFDSRPHVMVRLQRASNRIRIAADIRRLSSGGGTNALPALREAYLQLSGSNALVKHVILLSDGQSPENGINALLGDMRDADITVSSVGVGAGAGKDLLRRIARRGRGRFYFSHDGTDVPRIFSRETREVTRNAVLEKALFPRVTKSVQALRGIDFSGAPGLRGIVPIKPKAMAEVLLRTHIGEPLLVRGRRGLGRTAAFASDAKARWAARWMSWSGFPKLWSQLARDTMRQGATLLGGATIQIRPAADEGTYRVVADVDASQGFANDLVGEIEVLDPSLAPPPKENKDADGATKADDPRVQTLPLVLSAPGRYEAQIIGVTAGQRLVKAKLYDTSQAPRRLVAEAVSQVSVPYPPELLPQASGSQAVLEALSAQSYSGDVETILTAAGDPKGRERTKALWPYVLWGLVLPLLMFDLLLRRVSLGTRRVAG